VHQLETVHQSLALYCMAIAVHKGVAVNVASSTCHVGGVGGWELGDSVMGEAEWVWSTAVVCSSR
jgi:hypothetical protein